MAVRRLLTQLIGAHGYSVRAWRLGNTRTREGHCFSWGDIMTEARVFVRAVAPSGDDMVEAGGRSLHHGNHEINCPLAWSLRRRRAAGRQ